MIKKGKAPRKLALSKETLVYALGGERMPTGAGVGSGNYYQCTQDQNEATQATQTHITWTC